MAVPKVHKKIYLILEFLQRKLGTNFDIIVKGFSQEEKKKHPNANFLVGPTLRGREDPGAFAIHVARRVAFDKKEDADFQLFSSILHELIHAIYWPVADCHATALREVRSKVMKEHLDQEMYDSREAGTYALERAVAPILWKEYLTELANKFYVAPGLIGPEGANNGTHEDGKEEGSGTGNEEAHVGDRSCPL